MNLRLALVLLLTMAAQGQTKKPESAAIICDTKSGNCCTKLPLCSVDDTGACMLAMGTVPKCAPVEPPKPLTLYTCGTKHADPKNCMAAKLCVTSNTTHKTYCGATMAAAQAQQMAHEGICTVLDASKCVGEGVPKPPLCSADDSGDCILPSGAISYLVESGIVTGGASPLPYCDDLKDNDPSECVMHRDEARNHRIAERRQERIALNAIDDLEVCGEKIDAARKIAEDIQKHLQQEDKP